MLPGFLAHQRQGPQVTHLCIPSIDNTAGNMAGASQLFIELNSFSVQLREHRKFYLFWGLCVLIIIFLGFILECFPWIFAFLTVLPGTE